jgi:hypothetical protein
MAEEKHSALAPAFASEFRRNHSALFKSVDPVLRTLGVRMKVVADFYELSLTVVGCVGRKFAEGQYSVIIQRLFDA